MTPSPDELGAPASYLVLEEGTPVFSRDGERLGRIEQVRADLVADVFDGLVVESGALARKLHFVPADQVEEIYERGVVLKLDAAAARALPPPEAAAGGP
jgi:uncharacterized protein YrrD